MFIKIGDSVKTGFCTGVVVDVICGKDKGWLDTVYYELKVVKPRLPWQRSKQLIRIDEVLAKL